MTLLPIAARCLSLAVVLACTGSTEGRVLLAAAGSTEGRVLRAAMGATEGRVFRPGREIALASAAVARQAAPAGTAAIAGRAIDAVTGAPVANTLIGLSQRARSGPNTTPTMPNTQLVVVMADAQGRFVVRDVSKGSFLLLATAPGYIVSNYGQARAAGPTRTIDIAGTEALVDLTIKLWRHGVISGTVTDEAGEPVVGVTVRVLRRAPNGPGGEPRYQPGTETTTDDRGQYRLTQLSPGRFLVTVPQTQVTVPASVVDSYLQTVANRGSNTAGGQLIDLMSAAGAVPSAAGGVRIDDLLLQSSGNGRLMTVPPPAAGSVFVYPLSVRGGAEGGSTDEMAVGPGEERRNVDFTLRPVRGVRVSGVVTADGTGVANVPVRLIAAGGRLIQNENGFEAAATVTGRDGTFTLLGVAPGQYTLKAFRAPRVILPLGLTANPAVVAAYGSGGAAGAPATPAGAQLSLTVGDSEVRDVVVPMRPGAVVSGRVVFGDRPPPLQQIQAIGVLLSVEDGGLAGAPLQVARVTANSDFSLTAPAPGRYMLTPLMPPAGWKLASILAGGERVTRALDLSGDRVDVQLIFTKDLGEVRGTVRTSSGGAVSTAGVVVFPTDRSKWTQDPLNPWQPRLEQTSAGGTFAMPGFLPGEYFIAAIEDARMPDLPEPSFFETLSRLATRITVGVNQTTAQDLVVRSVR